MGHYQELMEEQMENMKKIGEKMPEVWEPFHKFLENVEKEGALDSKTKELIGLALAVKAQCHWCIAIHVKKGLGYGATKEEILEAAMVAVLMGGGPSLMYVKEVQDALEEFSS